MKAWVLHGVNDFRLEDVDMPVLSDDEVLVKVQAAGICGSDIPRVFQTGAHRHPLIPGHEFSGLVVALGERADKKWLDKRVSVFPLIPCGNCQPCRDRQYEMCRDYSYLGSRRDGGFAEYVAVPQKNLLLLPETVSYEEAAMLEPMAVAVHAMRRVNPTVSDTVVVCGLGTIGMLLLMFLKERGIKNLFVIGNKESQKEKAMALGVDEEQYCDSRKDNILDWIEFHSGGMGANVFFECVGKNETFAQAVDVAAPAGRICLVGNPYSDMMLEKPVYWKILRNQLVISGTWNSSYTGEMSDDWHYVLERLDQKMINPSGLITHKFMLEDIRQGFEIMRDKSEDYVKIMYMASDK